MKRGIKRFAGALRQICISKQSKVFCISMQRTGTTSVGKFFRDIGYRWAGWPADEKNGWSFAWYNGDYEAIFSSEDFLKATAFEDSPWFFPNFYKYMYYRYPDAKFILFNRDPDAWFKSMKSHSNGNVLGSSMIHCKLYRREIEYFELLKSGCLDERSENWIHSEKIMKITDQHADNYKSLYKLHTTEAVDFFNRHAPGSLFVGQLEDPEKWVKLAKFLGVKIPVDYDSSENSSQ